MRKNAPVAITGIGCLSAAGMSMKENMASLYTGKRRAAPPVRFSSGHPAPYPVFEVLDDPLSEYSPQHIDISRTCRLGIAAALEALRDAGLDPGQTTGLKVGVCMGTTVGSAMNNEEFYRDYRNGMHPDMKIIERFLAGNPASVIAREFRLNGPCQTVVNACSSGTDAIGVGASWIRSGICDMVIAGGADELCRVTYNGFISLMIADSSPCRPFDRDRKGLNLGEGAAVLILAADRVIKEEKMKARAFVLGYGSASDGYHLTAPSPEGKGLRNAMTDALMESGKAAGDIAFINAHGTATRDNDRTEAMVLREMLHEAPFFSTKGYTGHALGAAGAIEAAFTVACLESGMIPANAGFISPDPELGISPVVENTRISQGVAISDSLAFGGHNAVLVLGLDRG
ncbi:MAG: beta-ketoacyl-[acyl-carrier-protein] synthase family protein [Deltaproteobacteria bacterium]|nr:beta-ketoacyl-[acyl-carrier-protein] synthase family protein [Deltaproteobacteria bacterium]